MTDIQLEEVPEGKVYKTTHIAVAAFFGGIIVGTYLLAENFKVLGNKRGMAYTWVAGMLLWALIVLRPFLPTVNSIPGFVHNLIYTAIVFWCGRAFQLANINRHIDNGGIYSANRVTVVAVIGVGIFLFASIVLSFIRYRVLNPF